MTAIKNASLGTGNTTPSPAAPRENRPGGLFYATYVAAAFGLWVATVTPSSVSLAIRIGEVSPEGFAAIYSVVAGVGAVVSIPVSPIVGRLSDVSNSRFGRRRPFILAGGVLALAGALVLAWTTSTLALVIGWALVMIGNQVAVAPFWAVVSDKVFPRHQGLLMGLTGAMQSAAALAGTWFVAQTGSTFLMLFVPPAVGLGLVALFVVVVPEERGTSTERADLVATLKGLLFDPREEKGLAYALLAIGLLTAGSSVVGLYVLYYLEVQLGMDQASALDHVFVYSLITYALALTSAPVAGIISDRLGRRGLVYGTAAAFSAVGITIIVSTGTLDGFYVGAAFMGIATGVFSGQSMALVLSTGDASAAGRDLGLVGVAMSLPYSLVPLAAPFLLEIGGTGDNYAALFTAGIVLSLLVVPVLHRAHRSTRPTR